MKRFVITMFIVILGISNLFALQSIAEETDESYLAWYMKVFDFALPQSIVTAMHAAYQPQVIDCGDLQVTLEEILYDGHWLFTSATAIPTDPETTLLVPGSALIEDFVSGGYHEKLRDDRRSFIQAALEDGKRLLSVYVYPKEFDQLPVYSIDHLQDASNRSVLLSGACLPDLYTHIYFTWSIQIYEVSKVTGAYTLVDIYERPASISSLAPVLQKTYVCDSAKQLPFEEVSLLQTALSVYMQPKWFDAEDQGRYEFTLLNDMLQPIERGVRSAIDTYLLAELPKGLYIQINDANLDVQYLPVLFVQLDVHE